MVGLVGSALGENHHLVFLVESATYMSPLCACTHARTYSLTNQDTYLSFLYNDEVHSYDEVSNTASTAVVIC